MKTKTERLCAQLLFLEAAVTRIDRVLQQVKYVL